MLNTKNYEAQMDNMLGLIANENELDMAQARWVGCWRLVNAPLAEDNRLGVLAALIHLYEDQHWALEMLDPIFGDPVMHGRPRIAAVRPNRRVWVTAQVLSEAGWDHQRHMVRACWSLVSRESWSKILIDMTSAGRFEGVGGS
jgi:hypothetical protein